MDYQTLLLIKGIALSVLTVLLSLALIYTILTLRVWYKQLHRIDTWLNWAQNLTHDFVNQMKLSLLGISQSLGGVKDIAGMVWNWYQTQQAQNQLETNSEIKNKRKSNTTSRKKAK